MDGFDGYNERMNVCREAIMRGDLDVCVSNAGFFIGVRMKLWNCIKNALEDGSHSYNPYSIFQFSSKWQMQQGVSWFWDHIAKFINKTPDPRMARLDGSHLLSFKDFLDLEAVKKEVTNTFNAAG
jgi:hypothetical protein